MAGKADRGVGEDHHLRLDDLHTLRHRAVLGVGVVLDREGVGARRKVLQIRAGSFQKFLALPPFVGIIARRNAAGDRRRDAAGSRSAAGHGGGQGQRQRCRDGQHEVHLLVAVRAVVDRRRVGARHVVVHLVEGPGIAFPASGVILHIRLLASHIQVHLTAEGVIIHLFIHPEGHKVTASDIHHAGAGIVGQRGVHRVGAPRQSPDDPVLVVGGEPGGDVARRLASLEESRGGGGDGCGLDACVLRIGKYFELGVETVGVNPFVVAQNVLQRRRRHPMGGGDADPVGTHFLVDSGDLRRHLLVRGAADRVVECVVIDICDVCESAGQRVAYPFWCLGNRYRPRVIDTGEGLFLVLARDAAHPGLARDDARVVAVAQKGAVLAGDAADIFGVLAVIFA